jgi:hypothetical protein
MSYSTLIAPIAKSSAACFEQQQHLCAAWMPAEQILTDTARVLIALCRE